MEGMEAGLKGIRAFTNNSSCMIKGGLLWFRFLRLPFGQRFYFCFIMCFMCSFPCLQKCELPCDFEKTQFYAWGLCVVLVDAHKTDFPF